ncbi:MAG: hypothetical protein QOI12_2745 [Alphaproteobacteria bacterium]|jgi:glycosyltransferase involved in cell wall biosynthesis|nr:hypothetical protein [Alphaproteobacteria bacterium]
MPRISILLCTFDGAAFLPAQLASFENQTFANWVLAASDDGSSDASRAILSGFQQKWGVGRVDVKSGPGRGYIANFLSLVCSDIEGDYFALSDQDDVWEPDKLSRALDWLDAIPSHVPALYCSRTRLIDQRDREIGFSPLFRKPPSFANALVQCIAGGNTMVFNESARKIVLSAGPDVDVPSHDWWVYLATTAAGGRVFYDPRPSVRYRVHGRNRIGSNSGWAARYRRCRMLLKGRFAEWTEMNLGALGRIREHVTPENERTLRLLRESRRQNIAGRLGGIRRSGVYRQTTLGQLGLFFGASIGKI